MPRLAGSSLATHRVGSIPSMRRSCKRRPQRRQSNIEEMVCIQHTRYIQVSSPQVRKELASAPPQPRRSARRNIRPEPEQKKFSLNRALRTCPAFQTYLFPPDREARAGEERPNVLDMGPCRQPALPNPLSSRRLRHHGALPWIGHRLRPAATQRI